VRLCAAKNATYRDLSINFILKESFMSVEEKVKKIIVDHLGVSADQVTPDATFVDDLGADSLDLTELIMAMEEEFGIEIDDEDAQKMSKVKDALVYIQSKQQ
jgi:acyl carrier protein